MKWQLLLVVLGGTGLLSCSTERTTCTACFVEDAEACGEWNTDGDLGEVRSTESALRKLCNGDGPTGTGRAVPEQHRRACAALLEALATAPRRESGDLVEPPEVPTDHIDLRCTKRKVGKSPACVAF